MSFPKYKTIQEFNFFILFSLKKNKQNKRSLQIFVFKIFFIIKNESRDSSSSRTHLKNTSPQIACGNLFSFKSIF